MTSVPPPGGGYEPGGSWGWSMSGRGAASPSAPPSRPPASSPPSSPRRSLDPLSRRLLQLAGGLSVLLIVIVVFSWMHGGGETSLNPIARAAARTEAASGVKISVRYLYTYPSQSQTVTASGEGAFNGETGRSELSVDAPTPAGEISIEAVGDESTVYMRSEAFSDQLPRGAEWMRLDLDLAGSGEASAAGGSDLKTQLDQLRAVSGNVRRVGRAEVRGVKTTRYRASFDLHDYASYLREHGSESAAEQYEQIAQVVPATNDVEIWVDAEGLLRQMRIVTDYLRPKAGQPSSMDMTMDFFDYGVSPDIQLPDPGTVFDATSLVREQLGLDGTG